MPNLFGSMRNLPADGDTGWGEEMRTLLGDMITALDSVATIVSDVPYLVIKPPAATVELLTGASLAVTSNRIDVKGIAAGGAASPVVLGASDTSIIADGGDNGQTLLLVGTDGTGTVHLVSGWPNATINGDIILGDGDAIFLMWDVAGTTWIELSRSN